MSSPAPSPRQIAELYGLNAIKSLGQNFLFDMNITRKIVRETGDISGLNVIEVGPGPGGLTQAILEQDIAKLIAVEFDERAVAGLSELTSRFPEKISVISQDALQLDMRETCPAPRIVMSNLPYNISTKLLTNWLEYAEEFKFFILMFQKEVAERLAAVPRTKDYGRLTVMTQWLCDVDMMFHLPPTAFTPPPKVTSTVVRITPLAKPRFPADRRKLDIVLRAAFNQRRKMLRSSLKSVMQDVEAKLTSINIPATARAEELTVEQFCQVANLL